MVFLGTGILNNHHMWRGVFFGILTEGQGSGFKVLGSFNFDVGFSVLGVGIMVQGSVVSSGHQSQQR